MSGLDLVISKDRVHKALARAVEDGTSGAAAMAAGVTTLMWLHTIQSYQNRHGGSIREVATNLYKEGGVPRMYRGVGAALLQAPLTRFCDTAANSFVLSLRNPEHDEQQGGLHMALVTFCGSLGASLLRLPLMPLDTIKVMGQVGGSGGMQTLRHKISQHGPGVLFHGSGATVAGTVAGHFPWFYTYNWLDHRLPPWHERPTKRRIRNAGIGFSASVLATATNNVFHVVKTVRQAHAQPISYWQAAKTVHTKDGLQGLFTRGLAAKVATSGLQGLFFAVCWKEIQDRWFGR